MAYQIIQELCSGCHRCRVECPTGAIRFKNSKYWIEPEKCVSCGTCASVCHNDVIFNPEEEEQVVLHELQKKECDILVIGGGGSGMMAAARAASLGKKVIVLEKNKEAGGSAWYAHVLRVLWSKWHEQAGLQDPRDEVFREFMEKTKGSVNPKLVRNILDADAEFVDWLIEEEGIGADWKFGPLPFGGYGLICNYDWEYNHKRIDTTIGPGGTGWYMINKCLSILEEHGGEIYYYTAADQLIPDENGQIRTVLAHDKGGDLEISCKACIVAAGCYSRNLELHKKFQPKIEGKPGDEPVHLFACATCTGDGITMCESIGADIDYVNSRAGMFGPMRHPFGTASIAAACNPFGVMVNKNGDFYQDPGPDNVVSTMAKEPGRYIWHILDEESVATAEKDRMGREPDVIGIDMDAIYANWRQELETELAWETMYRADTLEELAEKIGADPKKLIASVEKANADSKKVRGIGEGPYYAIFMKMFQENGIGGMVVDETMRVLRGGRPIENLFAVGDNTRGEMVPGKVGMIWIESTISALTFAFCSGYIAAKEAVALVDAMEPVPAFI